MSFMVLSMIYIDGFSYLRNHFLLLDFYLGLNCFDLFLLYKLSGVRLVFIGLLNIRQFC